MVLDNGQMGIHAGKKHIILALDPGRDKTGFAFVNHDGGLILSGIFATSDSAKFFEAVKCNTQTLCEYITEGNFDLLPKNLTACIEFIAVGNGTHSKEFTAQVSANLPCEIVIADERNTTLEARELYWQIHKPGFLMRLIPQGLRVPDRILDDLAAWAIALRALKKYRDISRNKL